MQLTITLFTSLALVHVTMRFRLLANVNTDVNGRYRTIGAVASNHVMHTPKF